MARLASVVTAFALLVGAAPASASVWAASGHDSWPPIWPSWQSRVIVNGSDGVDHDIVVKPSGAKQLYGYPQRVDIYDYNDTFVAPPSGHPCHIISTHHAQCVVSGGTHVADDPYSYDSFARLDVDTGDGNDSVQVSDPLNPMIVGMYTAAGDDKVDVSGMWTMYDAYSGGALTLGAGNDTAHIGTAAPPLATYSSTGMIVFGGDGDDTIDTLNGSLDTVTCDDGNDTLIADPTDTNYFEPGFGPPRGNDCESRTPPAMPSP